MERDHMRKALEQLGISPDHGESWARLLEDLGEKRAS